MGRLTTHVLDIAMGRPAVGLKIELHALDTPARLLKTAITNADGRMDEPLLSAAEFRVGAYELHFFAGDYLRKLGLKMPEPAFLDIIPIRFGIAEPQANYHVPLLLSPFGYSTYRGS